MPYTAIQHSFKFSRCGEVKRAMEESVSWRQNIIEGLRLADRAISAIPEYVEREGADIAQMSGYRRAQWHTTAVGTSIVSYQSASDAMEQLFTALGKVGNELRLSDADLTVLSNAITRFNNTRRILATPLEDHRFIDGGNTPFKPENKAVALAALEALTQFESLLNRDGLVGELRRETRVKERQIERDREGPPPTDRTSRGAIGAFSRRAALSTGSPVQL